MYVQEANDRAEIAMKGREDSREQKASAIEEEYRQEWFDAVTTKSLYSVVLFDNRTDWELLAGMPTEVKAIGKTLPTRRSKVLELFNDQHDFGDFDARIAKIVIDAYRSGNLEAKKLLEEMAAVFAGSKV